MRLCIEACSSSCIEMMYPVEAFMTWRFMTGASVT
jgi:hypothetical protein